MWRVVSYLILSANRSLGVDCLETRTPNPRARAKRKSSKTRAIATERAASRHAAARPRRCRSVAIEL